MYSSDSNMWRQRWWSGLRACRPHEKVPLLLLHPISVLYLYWNSFVSVLYLFCICIIIVLYLCYIFFIFVLYLYCIAWESAAPPPSSPFHHFLSVLYFYWNCFVFVLYLYHIYFSFVLYLYCIVSLSSLTFLPTLQFLSGQWPMKSGFTSQEIWLPKHHNLSKRSHRISIASWPLQCPPFPLR